MSWAERVVLVAVVVLVSAAAAWWLWEWTTPAAWRVPGSIRLVGEDGPLVCRIEPRPDEECACVMSDDGRTLCGCRLIPSYPAGPGK